MRPMPENYYDGHLQSIIYGLDLASRAFLARRQGKRSTRHARSRQATRKKKTRHDTRTFRLLFCPPKLENNCERTKNSAKIRKRFQSSYLIVVVYPRISLFPFRSIVKRVQVCATTLFVVSLSCRGGNVSPSFSSSSPNLMVEKKTGGKMAFFPWRNFQNRIH